MKLSKRRRKMLRLPPHNNLRKKIDIGRKIFAYVLFYCQKKFLMMEQSYMSCRHRNIIFVASFNDIVVTN